MDQIKEKLRDLWIAISENEAVEKVKSSFDALPEREQRIIKVLGAFIFVIIVFNIVYSTMSDISEKEEIIKESGQIITQLDELNSLVSRSKHELKRMKKKSMSSKYISLLDIVEKQQNAAMIKPQSRVDIKETPRKEVENGKFYENTAYVKYNKITIRQLTRLLYGIEQNGIATKISTLKTKTRFDDDRYIDVEFEVVTRFPK